MRKFFWLFSGLWFGGLLLLAARADTFPLADGSSVSGDIIKITEAGLTFRQADATYTNLLWTKFSQEGLKQLAQNPKIAPLVEPFIIVPRAARMDQAELRLQPVTRLELPAKPSVFGGLFSSPVGLLLLLLIYAANLYAGYEVAICREKSVPLVMGLSAVLPLAGPAIFLSLPNTSAAPPETRAEAAAVAAEAAQATVAAAAAAAAVAEPAKPEEIHIVAASWQPGGTKTPPQVFQRGQFTFNRRFFETRFPGYFGSVRPEEDRNKQLVLKTVKGEFTVERILSVSTNDMSFETMSGGAKQEVPLPFADIQEMQIITKDP